MTTARAAAATVLLMTAAAAQFPATETQQFTSMTALDAYGEGLTVHGDVAFFGLPGDTNGAPSSGSIEVYRASGGAWSLEQTLSAVTPVFDGCFGEELDFDGTTLAVGATPPGGTGYVNVFTFDGAAWSGVEVDPPPGATSLFGFEVAVDGDWLLVSDPNVDTGPNENVGRVYAYEHVAGAWTHRQTLAAGTSLEFLNFGTGLDLSGTTAFIGTNLQRAFFFEHDGNAWMQEKLVASDDPSEDTNYGNQVAIDGDVAVVGTEGDDDAGNDAGAAYVYRRVCGSWVEEVKLTAAAPEAGDDFGRAVAVSGDVLLVGAYRDGHSGLDDPGSAHVFRWDGFGWQFEQLLVASDPDEDSWFGWSVALHGDVAIVGARLDDTFGPTSGKAYLYEAAPVFDPWVDLGFALAGIGGEPELSGAGTLDAGDPVQWDLRCAAPDTTAAFILGTSAIDAGFKGGVLVPAPTLVVAGLPVDGDGALTLAGTWPAGVPSATTLYQQVWVVDAAAPKGLSASNALASTTP